MIPNWQFRIVNVPITVGTSAYTASDVVGGTLTSAEIPQFQGGGMLSWVRLTDDADQSEPYLLYVYDAAPSTIGDGTAFAPTEADWLKTIGCIDISASDYDTSGSDACAFADAKDRKTLTEVCFDKLTGGLLYFRLVANGSTPDYAAADDLTLDIGMWVA